MQIWARVRVMRDGVLVFLVHIPIKNGGETSRFKFKAQ